MTSTTESFLKDAGNLPAAADRQASHMRPTDSSGGRRGESATQSGSLNGLTEREFELLRAIARGQSIKAIARTMGLTPKTVSNHQSAIKQKLAVESTNQLLKVAGQLGLSR